MRDPGSQPPTGVHQPSGARAPEPVPVVGDEVPAGGPGPATVVTGAGAGTSTEAEADHVPRLRAADGSLRSLNLRRWAAEADAVDERLLDGLVGPVLDLGCGPGRHVHALGQRGVPVLGVDAAGSAATLVRARGGAVLCRSLFHRLPAEGRWRTALLLDGNLGIGGDPPALLGRVGELVDPADGELVIETEAPGVAGHTMRARLEVDGEVGDWFWWSVISSDDLLDLAGPAGWRVTQRWVDESRWFARLVPATRTG